MTVSTCRYPLSLFVKIRMAMYIYNKYVQIKIMNTVGYKVIWSSSVTAHTLHFFVNNALMLFSMNFSYWELDVIKLSVSNVLLVLIRLCIVKMCIKYNDYASWSTSSIEIFRGEYLFSGICKSNSDWLIWMFTVPDLQLYLHFALHKRFVPI